MEMTIGQGRGSNPNSQKNLKRPDYKYYVLDSTDNSVVSGPHAFGVAYKKAEALNAKNGHRYFASVIEFEKKGA